jgi:electron transfer flavoprotein beta subunit
VRLRERLKDEVKSIRVVTIGSAKASDVLRTAMAMGADSAIHIETDAKFAESSILMGKQAIDDDSSQTGGMLAGLLDWPQANFASKVVIEGKTATVDREIDGGLEKLKMDLPAVVTTDLRLNEPRYATLPNIMKAKKKKIEKYTFKDLGIDENKEVRLETLKVVEPPKRKGGAKVESVDELVEKLKAAGAI